MLLKKEIKTKSNIKSKQKKCNFKNGTEKTVSLYDFAHLAFLLVVTVNWQKINKVSYKKLHSLGKDISKKQTIQTRLQFIISLHKLSNVGENKLVGSLNLVFHRIIIKVSSESLKEWPAKILY